MLNANFGYQMQMTVDLTVEILLTDKNSIRDNDLDAPLMIYVHSKQCEYSSLSA